MSEAHSSPRHRAVLVSALTFALVAGIALGTTVVLAAPGAGVVAEPSSHGPSGDGDITVDRKVQLMLIDEEGGEPFKVELGDMVPGESEAFNTPSGKSVLVTREDDGYTIDIDGKIIEVSDFGGHGLGGAHAHALALAYGGEGEDGDHRVILHKTSGEASAESGASYHYITIDDEGDGEHGEHGEHVFIKSGDESMVWVDSGENVVHAEGAMMVEIDADTEVTVDGEGDEAHVIRKVIRIGGSGDESSAHHAPHVKVLSGSECADAEDRMACIEDLLRAEGIDVELDEDGTSKRIVIERREIRSETKSDDGDDS